MSQIKNSSNKKTTKKKFIEPQFALRNPVLIDLFENVHIRTVYYMFIAVFICLFVTLGIKGYLRNGEIVPGLKLIKTAFADVHIALLFCLGSLSSTCLVYWGFNIWSRNRKFYPKLARLQNWDVSWLIILLTYYLSALYAANYLLIVFKLPVASSAIVLCEQVKYLLKVHAYVRSNIDKVIYHKLHDENNLILPRFSSFLYFLVAPTLLYQDTYPRTKKINWNFVCVCLSEFVAAIFFLSFIVDMSIISPIKDFGLRKYTIDEIILRIFENSIAGILVHLLVFFIIYHAWFNLVSEVTKFGDRVFFKDWWTCTCFHEFYRKWNNIVQDWIYYYLYNEVNKLIFYNNATLTKNCIFIVSAISHEVIITRALGIFFPFLSVTFLIFGVLMDYKHTPEIPWLNVLFWVRISFGNGLILTLYSFEYYARTNVPIIEPTLKDNIIPRFLTCDCIDYTI